MKLVEINEKNWLAVILLSTNGEIPKVCEEFVASNALSLVQAQFEGNWTTRAIEVNDEPIGFTMYGYSKQLNYYEICRIMIDKKWQGMGYGKKAMQLVIEEMKTFENCKQIYFSTDQKNNNGKKLYETLGFTFTKQYVDGEEVYLYDFNDLNEGKDNSGRSVFVK
ncbi:GNAT family N-acetyltransferase [Neobacillus sp. FSL H8-0543]|uniref:GNAT family N-acetyltransferase n=1 Tax=Neobacillus sp. FSL H8-0543 TaxID=2954672 RepID=UPI00315971CE